MERKGTQQVLRKLILVRQKGSLRMKISDKNSHDLKNILIIPRGRGTRRKGAAQEI